MTNFGHRRRLIDLTVGSYYSSIVAVRWKVCRTLGSQQFWIQYFSWVISFLPERSVCVVVGDRSSRAISFKNLWMIFSGPSRAAAVSKPLTQEANYGPKPREFSNCEIKTTASIQVELRFASQANLMWPMSSLWSPNNAATLNHIGFRRRPQITFAVINASQPTVPTKGPCVSRHEIILSDIVDNNPLRWAD